MCVGTIMYIQENKYVGKWDTGEARFPSTASANRFIEQIGMKTAPTKIYDVVEVVNPSM